MYTWCERKDLKDDGFIFQALRCTKSALLRCGAVLRPARANAYFLMKDVLPTPLPLAFPSS